MPMTAYTGAGTGLCQPSTGSLANGSLLLVVGTKPLSAEVSRVAQKSCFRLVRDLKAGPLSSGARLLGPNPFLLFSPFVGGTGR